MTHAIGVVGLGVMGKNLALNIESRGFSVAGYDLDPGKAQALVAGAAKGRAIEAVDSPERLMQALERPRRILTMVPAGKPVDDVIAHLRPHMQPGDILIDGGNSFFQDTERRCRELEAAGLRVRRHGRLGRRGRRPPRPEPDAGRLARGLAGAGAHPHRDRGQGRGRRAVRRAHRSARRRPLREDGPQRDRVRRHAADRRGLRPAPPRRGPLRGGAGHALRRSGTTASCARTSSRSRRASCASSIPTRGGRSST